MKRFRRNLWGRIPVVANILGGTECVGNNPRTKNLETLESRACLSLKERFNGVHYVHRANMENYRYGFHILHTKREPLARACATKPRSSLNDLTQIANIRLAALIHLLISSDASMALDREVNCGV